jgi:DNA-binding transcriptional MocR family regulator
MPLEPFERSLRAALRRHGTRLMEYGDPQGFPPLRQSLSRRLGQLGIRAGPEEILITHGAQQALDLVLSGLARPGDAVVVESPTYDQMLDLLAFKGLRPLALPLGRDGLDPTALDALLSRERPALLYTMPSFQNPTGRSLSQGARETLLDLCGRHGVPILEDGFEEEMKYFGRPVLPIKSMDRAGLVLYAGTFSKVLFPGLRVGWLAAPRPCVEALTALRRTAELCPAPLQQAALEDFLEKGHYDQHLARLHRRFRRRMETTLRALRREIDPALARWEAPAGGYLIWLELPRRVPEAALEAHLRHHGVKVQPGDRFFPEAAPRTCIRLSISGLDEEAIDTGIRRLALALRTLPVPLP